MKSMGDYHDLYLKTDVLLLADVFERFINTCLDYYGLDPCHYFSSPGLGWDAMLKMTKIESDRISDIDMLLFIEKGMRSGISYIAKRHSKANNKYMLSIIVMMSIKKVNTLLILTQIVYMVGQWVNIYHIKDLNG